MLWVAVCLATGIALGRGTDAAWTLPWIGCVTTGIAAAFFQRTTALLLPLLYLLLGWLAYCVDTALLSPSDIRLLAPPNPAVVHVLGDLLESPPSDDPPPARWHVPVRLRALKQKGLWREVEGQILLQARGLPPTGSTRGSMLEITGVLARPPSALLPGLFDYREHLELNGIHHTLSTESEADIHLLHPVPAHGQADPAIEDRFQRWGRRVLRLGFDQEDESLRLLAAMALGWKPGLSVDQSTPFMRSGTLHVFAVSGLHISLVAGAVASVLMCLRCGRGTSLILSIPIVWAYTFVTGFQASAIRSAVMTSVIALGWALKRPHSLLNSLGAAAAVILIVDPRQLFMAGFQLSFAAVFSLGWTGEVWVEAWRKRMQPDPLLPRAMETRGRRWMRHIGEWLGSALLTSAAATLGTGTLVAAWFHLVTPISLLANLVVIPLSSLALMSAMGSLLFGAWAPALSDLLNHSGWFWMNSMIGMSRWFASWPHGWWHVAAPSLPTVIGFTSLLLVTGLPACWIETRRRLTAWVCGSVLAGCFAVPLFTAPQLRIESLPLNGGDATLIMGTRVSGAILVDCGNTNACARVVIPWLQSRGINRLHTLVLTHPDIKHMGGAAWLAAQVPIQELVTSPIRYRTAAHRNLLQEVARSGVKQIQASAGDHIGPLSVQHPQTEDRYAKADDQALVLCVPQPNQKIWLLSDLGSAGQLALASRLTNETSRTALVIGGMPTGVQPLNEALCAALNPPVIWLQTATMPASELPKPELLSRLRDSAGQVFLAHREGGLQLEWRGERWTLRTGANARETLVIPEQPAHSFSHTEHDPTPSHPVNGLEHLEPSPGADPVSP